MRAFEVWGVALALVLVPLLAWVTGRIMGRRNWPIGGVLGTAIVFALGVQAGVVLAHALVEWLAGAGGPAHGGLEAIVSRRGFDLLDSPEFPVFLLILSCFVSMIGWSSTPADATAQ
jgi:hypothetical protein